MNSPITRQPLTEDLMAQLHPQEQAEIEECRQQIDDGARDLIAKTGEIERTAKLLSDLKAERVQIDKTIMRACRRWNQLNEYAERRRDHKAEVAKGG